MNQAGFILWRKIADNIIPIYELANAYTRKQVSPIDVARYILIHPICYKSCRCHYYYLAGDIFAVCVKLPYTDRNTTSANPSLWYTIALNYLQVNSAYCRSWLHISCSQRDLG